jgi:hypothetical protein
MQKNNSLKSKDLRNTRIRLIVEAMIIVFNCKHSRKYWWHFSTSNSLLLVPSPVRLLVCYHHNLNNFTYQTEQNTAGIIGRETERESVCHTPYREQEARSKAKRSPFRQQVMLLETVVNV